VGFDPSDPEQDADRAGGWQQRVEDVTVFVEGLIEGGPDVVANAIADLSRRAPHVLTPYAHHMAELAVNRGERRLLVYGLVANVVGGLNKNRRENLRVMAIVEDAATRLGVDLAELFDEVAATVGESAADSLALWLNRKPEDRSLAAMRYIVGDEPGDVIYVSDYG
jgi:hypothetical protein